MLTHTIRHGIFSPCVRRLSGDILHVLVALCTVLVYFFSLSNVAYAAEGCTSEKAAASTDQEIISIIVEQINTARKAEGLPPLKISQALNDAAWAHTADMVVDDYYNMSTYDIVDGELTYVCNRVERINHFYPDAIAIGEVLNEGFFTLFGSNSVTESWLNYEPTRATLLNANVWEIGVAYDHTRAFQIWTVDLGRRADVYPLIINDEAAATDSADVSLYIYGDWDEVRFTQTDGSWSTWRPFANTMAWQIPAQLGQQTVHAEMRNADGESTIISTDSIEYTGEEIRPTNTPIAPTATPEPTNTPIPPTATIEPTLIVPDSDVELTFLTNTPVPPTATLEPTSTPIPPTATPEPTSTPIPPTATLEPTSTPIPPTATPEPTSTPIPPTATPESTTPPTPPTATPEPAIVIPDSGVELTFPTRTPILPTVTLEPTSTLIPPTATLEPTSTSLPPTATPEPTSTSIPPTATPEPTSTSIPPTATPEPTSTPLPPTATIEPTSTSIPPTATPEPTSTSIPPTVPPMVIPESLEIVFATSTPRPTETPIPIVIPDQVIILFPTQTPVMDTTSNEPTPTHIPIIETSIALLFETSDESETVEFAAPVATSTPLPPTATPEPTITPEPITSPIPPTTVPTEVHVDTVAYIPIVATSIALLTASDLAMPSAEPTQQTENMATAIARLSSDSGTVRTAGDKQLESDVPTAVLYTSESSQLPMAGMVWLTAVISISLATMSIVTHRYKKRSN